MSSKLGVQNIAHTNGTNAMTVASDGVVTATNAIQAPGAVLQVKHFQTGAVANTGGSTMPTDDTILENDEGTEFLTLSITPKSASSKLLIQIVLVGSANDNSRQITAGLFQDSTSSALASAAVYEAVGTAIKTLSFNHYMTSGTTSETTFKVRAGSNSGIYTLNGYSTSSRTMGGVAASSITIMEIGG